jgi:hypothetical protein
MPVRSCRAVATLAGGEHKVAAHGDGTYSGGWRSSV